LIVAGGHLPSHVHYHSHLSQQQRLVDHDNHESLPQIHRDSNIEVDLITSLRNIRNYTKCRFIAMSTLEKCHKVKLSKNESFFSAK